MDAQDIRILEEKIKNTRDIENIEDILGKELGSQILTLLDVIEWNL